MSIGKVALEAGTDQALAIARDRKGSPGSAYLLPAAGHLAGTIAEQFAGDEALAGRVLMAASQFLATAGEMGVGLVDLTVIVAFAAEQVVREAAES